MANKFLIGGLLLYVLTIVFSYFQLPGTVELAVFSIPTVSLLLFRYYRMNFKSEGNLFIRFFTLILSFFISITLMTPILYLKGDSIDKIALILLLNWVTLILMNIFYYSYYFFVTNNRENKVGYLILIITGILFLIESSISFMMNPEYFELKVITYVSLSFLALYVFAQVLQKKAIPKIALGNTLLIGAIFIYMIDIFLLLTR